MTDVYKDSGTKFGVLKRFLSVVIWNCSSNSMSFKRNETEIYLICILKYRHSTFMILEGENINKTKLTMSRKTQVSIFIKGIYA